MEGKPDALFKIDIYLILVHLSTSNNKQAG